MNNDISVEEQPYIKFQQGKFYKVKGKLYKGGRGTPPKGYEWEIAGVLCKFIGMDTQRNFNGNWTDYAVYEPMNGHSINEMKGEVQ